MVERNRIPTSTRNSAQQRAGQLTVWSGAEARVSSWKESPPNRYWNSFIAALCYVICHLSSGCRCPAAAVRHPGGRWHSLQQLNRVSRFWKLLGHGPLVFYVSFRPASVKQAMCGTARFSLNSDLLTPALNNFHCKNSSFRFGMLHLFIK